jgi:hypothetical protein
LVCFFSTAERNTALLVRRFFLLLTKAFSARRKTVREWKSALRVAFSQAPVLNSIEHLFNIIVESSLVTFVMVA